MEVFVFGNQDVEGDDRAIEVAKGLEGKIEGIKFLFPKPNEDVPFVNNPHVVIMDMVMGLPAVKELGVEYIDKLILAPSCTTHDFDLGFQLKYLKKLGKIEKVTIVGLPMTGEIDYSSIQSILRKLVAQDIQGS